MIFNKCFVIHKGKLIEAEIEQTWNKLNIEYGVRNYYSDKTEKETITINLKHPTMGSRSYDKDNSSLKSSTYQDTNIINKTMFEISMELDNYNYILFTGLYNNKKFAMFHGIPCEKIDNSFSVKSKHPNNIFKDVNSLTLLRLLYDLSKCFDMEGLLRETFVEEYFHTMRIYEINERRLRNLFEKLGTFNVINSYYKFKSEDEVISFLLCNRPEKYIEVVKEECRNDIYNITSLSPQFINMVEYKEAIFSKLLNIQRMNLINTEVRYTDIGSGTVTFPELLPSNLDKADVAMSDRYDTRDIVPSLLYDQYKGMIGDSYKRISLSRVTLDYNARLLELLEHEFSGSTKQNKNNNTPNQNNDNNPIPEGKIDNIFSSLNF